MNLLSAYIPLQFGRCSEHTVTDMALVEVWNHAKSEVALCIAGAIQACIASYLGRKEGTVKLVVEVASLELLDILVLRRPITRQPSHVDSNCSWQIIDHRLNSSSSLSPL